MARKKGAEMDVRGALLSAATALFVERGADGLSVNGVIDRAGLSKGTFYHYFSSREDLLEAIVTELAQLVRASVRDALAAPGRSALEKLDAVLRASRELKHGRRELVLSLSLALYRDANMELRRRFERASRELFVPVLTGIFEEGVAEGSLDMRHPAETASIVMSLMHAQREEQLRLVFAAASARAVREEVERSIDAFYDALERIVGAPRGSIARPEQARIADWLAMIERS